MRIYIDMDDVLCDFSKAYREKFVLHKKAWPQSEVDFFRKLEPIKDAIKSVEQLDGAGYDVWVLTAPSVDNPLCYMEKILWIKDHFPALDLDHKTIMSRDKGCVGEKGDYLIDDNTNTHGQDKFKGTFLHFTGSWKEIMKNFT